MTDRKIYDSPIIVLPHSQEHWDLSQNINILKDENNWLEDAIPLDIYLSKSKRLRGLINRLFAEVEGIIPTPNRSRYREVLKMVIINLWNGHFRGKPIKYSRDRSYYARNSRYGKLFIKYDRLMPVIRALEALGYIEQKMGFWDDDKKLGRTTRMWPTTKLWRQFRTYNLNQPDFFNIARPEKAIVLREGGKHNKGIKFALTPAIRHLLDDLERYNDFLDQHDITVNLDATVKVSTEFLANTLYKGILNNTIEVDSVDLTTRINSYNFTVGVINRPVVQLFSSNKPYNSITTNQYLLAYHLIQTTMTQRILPEALVFLGFRQSDKSIEMLTNYLADLALSISMDPVDDRRKARLTEIIELKEIGIERLGLRLTYEYIHRVFNRESFKLGGRGYGALHQRIPKHLRPHIQINGQPTVELDYSAYHILMLYHMEGIDYHEDPYLVCEGPEMRKTYKAVALPAINAKDERQAYGAIRDELLKRGIPIPARENPLISLVNTFRNAHKPISKYLCSDIGITLQNIDSKIMNAILMSLMDQGILGLSVYDSVIVGEQYRDILYETMIREYEAVMGFKPRL